jgi:hypothetical protein
VSAAFEVGQKVTHSIRGSVEIAYGPYTNTVGSACYVMRLEGGREVSVQADTLSAIPEPPKFAVGDKVTSDGSLRGKEGVLVAGPFVSRFQGDHFWVADVNGLHYTPKEDDLRQLPEPAPIKVGDRVRVVKDADGIRSGWYVGLVGVVERIDSTGQLPYLVRFGDGSGRHGDKPNGRWYCESVERVEDENTYTHDGVTYDLTARYRDNDGDVWKFKRIDGTVRGNYTDRPVEHWDSTLTSVADSYGPLTRVND